MTSGDRREGRYQRRKADREAKRLQRSKALGDFEEVFSFRKLYLAGRKCCKNVMWKNSTQRFLGTILLEVATIHEQLLDGTFTGKGFIHFVIMERGKLRHIRSVHITERGKPGRKGHGLFSSEDGLPPPEALPQVWPGRRDPTLRLLQILRHGAPRPALR